jgi:DNA-binding GntR family transcriptional regulator
MGGGILGMVASNNANEANYDAQVSEADLARLEALLEKLKKALEEDSDEIKALLQQLMEAMADLSKLLESAQETTDQITGEIGATA